MGSISLSDPPSSVNVTRQTTVRPEAGVPPVGGTRVSSGQLGRPTEAAGFALDLARLGQEILPRHLAARSPKRLLTPHPTRRLDLITQGWHGAGSLLASRRYRSGRAASLAERGYSRILLGLQPTEARFRT